MCVRGAGSTELDHFQSNLEGLDASPRPAFVFSARLDGMASNRGLIKRPSGKRFVKSQEIAPQTSTFLWPSLGDWIMIAC